MIFEELSFCHFLLQVLLLLVKAHSNLVDLSFEYLCFSSKWKTTILFPVLSHFFNGPCRGISLKRDNCFLHYWKDFHIGFSCKLVPVSYQECDLLRPGKYQKMSEHYSYSRKFFSSYACWRTVIGLECMRSIKPEPGLPCAGFFISSRVLHIQSTQTKNVQRQRMRMLEMWWNIVSSVLYYCISNWTWD